MQSHANFVLRAGRPEAYINFAFHFQSVASQFEVRARFSYLRATLLLRVFCRQQALFEAHSFRQWASHAHWYFKLLYGSPPPRKAIRIDLSFQNRL